VTVSATDESTQRSQHITIVTRGVVQPPEPDTGGLSSIPTDVLHEIDAQGRPVIDATTLAPAQAALLRRADLLLNQAEWLLAHAQPSLDFFSRTALESISNRVRAARNGPAVAWDALAAACADLDHLRHSIAQWPNP